MKNKPPYDPYDSTMVFVLLTTALFIALGAFLITRVGR